MSEEKEAVAKKRKKRRALAKKGTLEKGSGCTAQAGGEVRINRSIVVVP